MNTSNNVPGGETLQNVKGFCGDLPWQHTTCEERVKYLMEKYSMNHIKAITSLFHKNECICGNAVERSNYNNRASPQDTDVNFDLATSTHGDDRITVAFLCTLILFAILVATKKVVCRKCCGIKLGAGHLKLIIPGVTFVVCQITVLHLYMPEVHDLEEKLNLPTNSALHRRKLKPSVRVEIHNAANIPNSLEEKIKTSGFGFGQFCSHCELSDGEILCGNRVDFLIEKYGTNETEAISNLMKDQKCITPTIHHNVYIETEEPSIILHVGPHKTGTTGMSFGCLNLSSYIMCSPLLFVPQRYSRLFTN
jgi:hypothetical protein